MTSCRSMAALRRRGVLAPPPPWRRRPARSTGSRRGRRTRPRSRRGRPTASRHAGERHAGRLEDLGPPFGALAHRLGRGARQVAEQHVVDRGLAGLHRLVPGGEAAGAEDAPVPQAPAQVAEVALRDVDAVGPARAATETRSIPSAGQATTTAAPASCAAGASAFSTLTRLRSSPGARCRSTAATSPAAQAAARDGARSGPASGPETRIRRGAGGALGSAMRAVESSRGLLESTTGGRSSDRPPRAALRVPDGETGAGPPRVADYSAAAFCLAPKDGSSFAAA